MAGRYQQEAAVALCPCARARFAEETLLIEWPEGEAKPTKYWLTTVDPKMSLRELVDLAKLRWRIERDYEDLKQETGLGHYEGRGWRGFHHHATLAITAARTRCIVAIEFGTWRCNRIGGASGSITTGKGRFFDWRGAMWS